ncbi:unnamed protein product [Phaedon cochleariae]|uniref:Signal-induced proliferation-associated 1-like protein 2 n=1 Tax=Phaedon cochleariae TaxID=80249 RepID=A0A9N9SHW3_PHACE|nr:unnamed protein product [Phaedon cochleariae]
MIGLHERGPASPRAPPTTSVGVAPPTVGGRLRDRAAIAVDYYNGRVQRAWADAGLGVGGASHRASFNDRHGEKGGAGGRKAEYLQADHLCRSNSSLELLDHSGQLSQSEAPFLRREYGSHGSIDVVERGAPHGGKNGARHVSNEFFQMLQDYRPAGLVGTDQRSPGPSEYLRGKVEGGAEEGHVPHSPKHRTKGKKLFWANASGTKQAMDDSTMNCSSTSINSSAAVETDEIARRRAFAHYDCQSLTTNLRLRMNLLARRRNTTTGASAASMLTRSSTPDGDSEDDCGDGNSNDLVDSCPFFRNETGGEEERIVSLSRLQNGGHSRKPLHRPPLAYGVAVLEFAPGKTHWRHSTCPYQRFPRPIENIDQGALYYKKFFVGQEHQNWFGMDERLGPVVISIKREKVIHPENQLTTTLMQYQYRLVVRTSELHTLRGAVLEDAVPHIKPSGNAAKSLNAKEVLEYVTPEVQLGCLRLGFNSKQVVDQILKLDEQGLTNHYKVGVMYCKAGQNTEEEMYNNEEAGPAFLEFLETIGKRVRLQGFDKYKAGLDNKTDSTGLYSVYAQYQECEVMFHVSTLLPFTKNNRQQLLRKRHIGNDIVTIVFQEPGALPFTPKGIRSQFQHVFVVVSAIDPCTENTHYKVAVSRSRDVEVFGPPIKEGGIYPKGKVFQEFLLAKVVNAENAAHRSEKFVTMATRTRQEYLKELVVNHSTSTILDTGQKFSIFSTKKKEKIRHRFIPDLCQRGAILWQVLLDDSGQGQQIECFLGISSDTFVLIEETSKQIVFVTPCKSVLGWSPQTNSLRLYHHQGECMTIHMRDSHADRDELMEIMDRLKAVTFGHLAQEVTISRNIMGQLGFHVQPDGVVTLVEMHGQAWQAGLRQNSRLVEICKVAVATLTYDQMVDLLKTSVTVMLTVIPPLPDGSPRKGCTLQNCKYNETNYEGDYDNTSTAHTGGGGEDPSDPPGNKGAGRGAGGQAHSGGHHRRVYERSFSPPRSSNSSGYGTGSSSKSFHGVEGGGRYQGNGVEGTLASLSSVHSGEGDKWYDILQDFEAPFVPLKTHQHSSTSSSSSCTNVRHVNNTFPGTPKRNDVHQAGHGHHHYTIQHNKVQMSNSLPLQHVDVSQPLSAVVHNNANELELYKRHKNNIIKQHNDRLRQESEYAYARSQKFSDYATSDFHKLGVVGLPLPSGDTIHSAGSSISDRLNLLGVGGAASEDDLSTGSAGGGSPRAARRAAKHANNSPSGYSASNRTHSPRSANGEAKLRPGVTARSSNRNSANLSTAFQEELLRLINPDNIEATSGDHPKDPKTHSSSRDNLNQPISLHRTQPEVILTTARPATVISNSSTTSSPLPQEVKTLKSQEELSGRLKSKPPLSFPDDFPLPEDSDWPSLVDTATSFMNQVGGGGGGGGSASEGGMMKERETGGYWNGEEAAIDASITSSVSSSTSVPELQNHVAELELKVNRETRRRKSLENEVRRLTDENRKLQDQANAAVQQLRKFTEWFFKNVKKQ